MIEYNTHDCVLALKKAYSLELHALTYSKL